MSPLVLAGRSSLSNGPLHVMLGGFCKAVFELELLRITSYPHVEKQGGH